METTTGSTEEPVLLERYNIQMRLGRGGSGDVYLTYDVKRSEKVAVKILKNIQTPKSVNLKERFIQEAERTKELSHENIVKVHEIHEIGRFEYREEVYKDTFCFSMEYVEGKSLTNVVKQGYRRSKDINHICEQILQALNYLHSQGIVHRDLKPGNIYLTDQRKVKLIDLGLMKADGSSIRTADDVLLGTVQYMAPEYMKHKTVDARGDIYALGIVLLEILIGKHLYEGMATEEIAKYLFEVDFRIEDRILNELPPKYRYIVLKATAFDPDDRFQTAKEMSDALKENSEEYFREGLNSLPQINSLNEKSSEITVVKEEGKTQNRIPYILFTTAIITITLVALLMQ